MKNIKQTESGFSLIQLMIVIVIVSLGLTAAAKLATVQFHKDREEEIKTSFANIDDLLLAHYIDNTKEHLPCPARRDLPIDHPDFGKADCNAFTPVDSDRTHPDGSGNALRVMIGALPVRELSLSTQDAFDVFGGQLIYAVSEELTSPTNFGLNNLNAVRFRDPEDLTEFTGIALPYVVVSAGESGNGTYNMGGTLIGACPAGNTPDSENCNDDFAFLNTDISEADNVTTFYDDRVGFDENFAARVSNTIISNASCPTGEYLTGIQQGLPNCETIEENVPACPNGQYLTAISNGNPVCETVVTNVSSCSSGQYLAGVSNGNPVCRDFPTASTPPPTGGGSTPVRGGKCGQCNDGALIDGRCIGATDRCVK